MNIPEKKLNPKQETDIIKLKKQWLSEAEPYLSDSKKGGTTLDGPDSVALAQIQQKYTKKIREIINGTG